MATKISGRSIMNNIEAEQIRVDLRSYTKFKDSQIVSDGTLVGVITHLLNRIEKLEDALADYGLLVHEEDICTNIEQE